MEMLNTVANYRNLQPFKTIEEHNDNVKVIREKHGEFMSKNDKSVLDVLNRYSAKYFGLSHLSKNKIAEMVGVSRRTVIRICNKFEEMGIIKQYGMQRKIGDKRQSSNAVVFIDIREVKEDSHTTCHSECHTDKTLNNTPNLNNTKGTDIQPKNADDKSYLKTVLPKGWYEQAVAYAKNAQDLYAITGELFKAKKGTTIKIEDYVDEFGEILRQAWFSLKNGRIKEDKWYAYLFAAFRNKANLIESYENAKPIMQGIKEMFDPKYISEKECLNIKNKPLLIF